MERNLIYEQHGGDFAGACARCAGPQRAPGWLRGPARPGSAAPAAAAPEHASDWLAPPVRLMLSFPVSPPSSPPQLSRPSAAFPSVSSLPRPAPILHTLGAAEIPRHTERDGHPLAPSQQGRGENNTINEIVKIFKNPGPAASSLVSLLLKNDGQDSVTV